MILLRETFTGPYTEEGHDIYYFHRIEFDPAAAAAGNNPIVEVDGSGGVTNGVLPPDYELYNGSLITQLCIDFDLVTYYYDGLGGYTEAHDPNNVDVCAYVAPPLTCSLQLSYEQDGNQVTAAATGAHGAVAFSIGNGAPQASPFFANLTVGNHTLRATDGGLSGCFRTAQVTVLPAPLDPDPIEGAQVPAGPPTRFDFSQHPIWYPVAAAEGTEVVLELWVEQAADTGLFTKVATQRKRAGREAQVTFRLDSVLRRLISAHMPAPVAYVTELCGDNVRHYYVRTALVNSLTQLPGAFTSSSLRTVLRGGLPAPYQETDYFAYWQEREQLPPFLTWQPRDKVIVPGQPEWLFWLCPVGTGSTVTVNRRYTQPALVGPGPGPATLVQEVVDVSGGRGSRFKLLAIPVRTSEPGAASVQVWLSNANDEIISEVFDYVLTPATARTRFYLFTNSLGGFDVLRTEGQWEGTLDSKDELAERIRVPGRPAAAGSLSVVALDATRKLKVTTGFLTSAQLRWLQELVLSKERWEFTAGRMLPILLGKRALSYAQSEVALRGYTFEYDYAFESTAYANLP